MTKSDFKKSDFKIIRCDSNQLFNSRLPKKKVVQVCKCKKRIVEQSAFRFIVKYRPPTQWPFLQER